RGAIVGAIFCGAAVYTFGRVAIGAGPGWGQHIALFAVSWAAAMLAAAMSRFRALRRQLPLVISDAGRSTRETDAAVEIAADQIEAVEARENNGRYRDDL